MIKCRLKVLLAEHDMNQKELAEKTGIDATTISKMCRNELIRVPLDAIDKITDVFQCEITDILVKIN